MSKIIRVQAKSRHTITFFNASREVVRTIVDSVPRVIGEVMTIAELEVKLTPLAEHWEIKAGIPVREVRTTRASLTLEEAIRKVEGEITEVKVSAMDKILRIYAASGHRSLSGIGRTKVQSILVQAETTIAELQEKKQNLIDDARLEEEDSLSPTAANLLNEGWLIGEIESYLSYSEEVNPELSETYALGKMEAIRRAVEKRIERESNSEENN